MLIVCVAVVLLILDALQTAWICRQRDWRELNPVIRFAWRRAGEPGVFLYFAVWIAAVVWWGQAFVELAMLVVILEAGAVLWNWKQGARI